ncbi:MAG TPA: DUF551 domain-containing protein [Candidatus Nitrosopolaris rasttigaisensis]|nr:DUF551 domain-containing protein [Candidatus Nitrosopolaris rasttigaisensis]
MDWISVKNRLPENGQAVLIYQTYPKRTMFKCLAWPLIYCFHEVAEYETYRNGFVNNKNNLLKHVSHWMPLPEPPKEENET